MLLRGLSRDRGKGIGKGRRGRGTGEGDEGEQRGDREGEGNLAPLSFLKLVPMSSYIGQIF